jgi:hypothetical protein
MGGNWWLDNARAEAENEARDDVYADEILIGYPTGKSEWDIPSTPAQPSEVPF